MRNETPFQRLERLTLQAQAMRERQAELKRLGRPKHQCPPHKLDDQFSKLMAVLERVAPANIAPIPIAFMQEDGQWSVDIHVRIRGVTEYEVTGTGDTLSDAIANAQRHLSQQTRNERQASLDSDTFTVAY